MFIKIMSQENLPDSNVFKHHQIVETKEYIFFFDEDNKMDAVRYFDQISKSYKTIWLEQTNVYIMNDDGKTINCFQPKPRKPEHGDHWTKSLQQNEPVGDKLTQSPQHIDYMSIFHQHYKLLNERVYNKILTLNDFQALKENLIIKITGPRQSGKTEFCLQLNKEYNCINISKFGTLQIPAYKTILIDQLDDVYPENDEVVNTALIVVDDAYSYSPNTIDEILKWAFKNFDTQPYIVLVG